MLNICICKYFPFLLLFAILWMFLTFPSCRYVLVKKDLARICFCLQFHKLLLPSNIFDLGEFDVLYFIYHGKYVDTIVGEMTVET